MYYRREKQSKCKTVRDFFIVLTIILSSSFISLWTIKSVTVWILVATGLIEKGE